MIMPFAAGRSPMSGLGIGSLRSLPKVLRRLPGQLADVAFTMVANLGFLAQAEVQHENRPPLGNDMYGAFGRDFATSDGRRVMVVAISLNQWRTLVKATGIEEHLPPMERAFDADFTKEADRYRARDGIATEPGFVTARKFSRAVRDWPRRCCPSAKQRTGLASARNCYIAR